MSEQEIAFTESSGNVFADLSFPDSENALAKAQLAAEISAAIAEQGLSQTEAAAVLNLGQPKVSAIMRGQLRGFSLERLIRCLRALRRNVDIVVTAAPHPLRTGRLGVVSKRGTGQPPATPKARVATMKTAGTSATRKAGKRKTQVVPA